MEVIGGLNYLRVNRVSIESDPIGMRVNRVSIESDPIGMTPLVRYGFYSRTAS